MKGYFLTTVLIVYTLPFGLFAQTNPASNTGYVPLETVPGVTQTGTSVNLASYIPAVIKLAIGLAGALAVVMIVVGGIQYLSTDAWFDKKDGVARIKNALWGLGLAISSWLILYTINPHLVTLQFPHVSLPETTFTFTSPTTTADVTAPSSAGNMCLSNDKGLDNQHGFVSCSCVHCVNGTTVTALSDGTRVSLAFNQNAVTKGSVWMTDSLYQMLGRLKDSARCGSGLACWNITEAWPPTVHHSDNCQRDGSCVDANFLINPPTDNAIHLFIEKAAATGLTACYEVESPDHKTRIISSNAFKNDPLASHILAVVDSAGHPLITAPHFSVYGDGNPSCQR